MRVALVSPYSWTYPGGVTRHIEALAGELERAGHDARILAPFDPDDRLARVLHRGAAPQRREPPERLVELGRTLGVPANGAVSNVAYSARTVLALRSELRSGRYDVVHVHEPIVPLVCWDALCCVEGVPLVGTFHSYSENLLTNGIGNLLGARRRMNRLQVRIAVSEAAAWTARRFFGGEYRIIPNGVHVEAALPEEAGHPVLAYGSPPSWASADDGDGAHPGRRVGAAVAAPGGGEGDGRRPLRILFIGQPVERKGLPILLSAFEALRDAVPATLTIVGTLPEEAAPLLLEERGVRALGKVGEHEKALELMRADVLCAPSLHGESFGMVLTEAFAAGLPVIASDIAGYRDVVRHDRDGVLVPPGDPLALAEALRAVALDGERRARMALAARERAERYAWPRVAAEVSGCYEDALAAVPVRSRARRLAVRYGLLRTDLPVWAANRGKRPATLANGAIRRKVGGGLEDERAPGLGARSPGRIREGSSGGVEEGSSGGMADHGAGRRIRARGGGVALISRMARPFTSGGETPGRGSRRVGAHAGRLRRRIGRLALLAGLGAVLTGAADLRVGGVEASLAASSPSLLTIALGVMCGAMALRGIAWHTILRAAVTRRRPTLADALQGTFIGVLMSATLPARLGEPSRALVVARRLGRAHETLPAVLATVVSQALLNLLALASIGIVAALTSPSLRVHRAAIGLLAVVPVAGLLAVVLAALALPGAAGRSARLASLLDGLRLAAERVREGLRLLASPLRGGAAALLQLAAWALQLLACWLLLDALGLADSVDMAGVVAVLFAVNVTALLPATPANVGVFQAAVVAVLVGVYHVSLPAALAYGIVLQAVEVLAALVMGVPALAREGISWRELRLRSMHASPVRLAPVPEPAQEQVGVGA